MSWRVVIVTMIPPVLLGFDGVLREAGHKPVALLTMRSGPLLMRGGSGRRWTGRAP